MVRYIVTHNIVIMTCWWNWNK